MTEEMVDGYWLQNPGPPPACHVTVVGAGVPVPNELVPATV